MIKLKRTKAAGLYVVVGHEHIHVQHNVGSTWRPREGSVPVSTWHAYDTSRRQPEDGPDYDCKPFVRVGTIHKTLASLKEELTKILEGR